MNLQILSFGQQTFLNRIKVSNVKSEFVKVCPYLLNIISAMAQKCQIQCHSHNILGKVASNSDFKIFVFDQFSKSAEQFECVNQMIPAWNFACKQCRCNAACKQVCMHVRHMMYFQPKAGLPECSKCFLVAISKVILK